MGGTERQPGRTSEPGPTALDGVTAVVLTYKRPRLATEVVRSLLEVEGLPPERVVVVVNGIGGLDDPALEASVRMVRLPTNTGPAGGFRAGLLQACADPSTRWVYLCEDDVGLFDLPTPRLSWLLDRIGERPVSAHPLGAVVAYGRRFVGRGTHTQNLVPADGDADLVPVDVACWGATLVSRSVVDAGVEPDPAWFFGLEDFDFFCRVREAGYDVLVDSRAARAVAGQQTVDGRRAAITTARPDDDAETWRTYYHARNSVTLVRRHGRPTWYAWQLAYTARWLQSAKSPAQRSAILHGLWDGIRGVTGERPGYGRTVGEFGGSPAR